METTRIKRASDAPKELQQAAKVAFAIGAVDVSIGAGGDILIVDNVAQFDPFNNNHDAMAALGNVRAYGYIAYRMLPHVEPDGEVRLESRAVRDTLVTRIVCSATDVRVQIGASRWYADVSERVDVAMRHALVNAFCDYYDQAIAPNLTEA